MLYPRRPLSLSFPARPSVKLANGPHSSFLIHSSVHKGKVKSLADRCPLDFLVSRYSICHIVRWTESDMLELLCCVSACRLR